MRYEALVKLSQSNKVQVWFISEEEGNSYINYGRLDNIIKVKTKITNVKTSYKKQLNKGYVKLSEISKTFNIDDGEVEQVVVHYLINNNLTNKDGVRLPMLAKKYLPEMKLKFPMLGQPKLDGVRALISYKEEHTDDLFREAWENVIISTKSGNRYWMPHISKEFYKRWFQHEKFRDYEFDGEFYIHGKGLNYIKSCVPLIINGMPSNASGNTNEPLYHIFDIIRHEEELQDDRITFLNDYVNTIYTRKVSTVSVGNIETALDLRDLYINDGYEGLITRNPNATYQYGKRNSAMYKFKRHDTGEFVIVDVVDTGFKAGRVNIVVICRNNINDETFRVTPGSLDSSWDNSRKQHMLVNKEDYIGKLGTVTHYGRSGVSKVPFHANFVTVRNYE